MAKERSGFLSIFTLILLLSIFLIIATWKNRAVIPTSLTVLINIISTFFILASILAMIFIVSFGYNS